LSLNIAGDLIPASLGALPRLALLVHEIIEAEPELRRRWCELVCGVGGGTMVSTSSP
jgi:hypothetical protein